MPDAFHHYRKGVKGAESLALQGGEEVSLIN